jgi:hypothetical protein
MDNPETQGTLDTKDTKQRQTNQQMQDRKHMNTTDPLKLQR